jgi:formylglycine-generating enzyme required for sulfatase activity
MKQALIAILILLTTAFTVNAESPQATDPPGDSTPMVLIPAGEFLMGRDMSPSKKPADEKPAHKVYLDAFYIDKYEVTNAQYEKFDPEHQRSKYSACNDCPVTNVSWEEARDFCAWADKRLPTEAEWEKAARGPQNYLYPYGDTYDQTLARTGRLWPAGTMKVGSYTANGYGVYDMTGNVWEWCNDWYAADYYSNSPLKNPKGPESGRRRVLRGGAWNTGLKVSHTVNRYHDIPSIKFHSFGFRCAKGIQKQEIDK